MLLRELEYVKPDSVDEALEWLGRLSDAGLLAGGQSLINVLKMRIGGYQTLIDISKLEDLKRIEMVGQGIRIGAGVTYDELLHSPAISLYRPLLQEVALRIADPQVRNRGTVGGNCCYNDPTCHLPPYLTAIGATFEARGPKATRMILARDFFVSYYQTALAPGEMLVGVYVPIAKRGSGDGFRAMSVGGTDVLNIVAGASTVTLKEDGTIGDVAVVVTGVAEHPLRLDGVESQLVGSSPEPSDVRSLFSALDTARFDPVDDVHASAEYRLKMAPIFVRRALEQALDNARRGLRD